MSILQRGIESQFWNIKEAKFPPLVLDVEFVNEFPGWNIQYTSKKFTGQIIKIKCSKCGSTKRI